MKTRNLLILAFLSGLAIVIAGVVKLVQVNDNQATVTSLQFGEVAEVGAVTVRVTGADATSSALLVRVEIRGVDDDDVGDHWNLLVAGEPDPVKPIALPVSEGATCAQVRVEADLTCTVAFPPVEGSYVIAYKRSNGQANWAPA